ncbi:hypothetical protein [Flammeovirga kamogawensis]|uniref:Porin family protein n=1 Tax=Flammeovirga kamogawensis TaxID=373891 RepID=A0ABX8H2Q7_9BACT|nr:hypothetical protein [Flammeovirga kamogawensis]MBB6460388.1 hypothetical protein [Flammeovirga kamogawensis]QWG10194.1 hypothetical protein KM029_21160 [Flammeovirga kamogawensis]TRX64646.1 hypothetical protein EO216_19090 [Flammeovirga kamogawensis]
MSRICTDYRLKVLGILLISLWGLTNESHAQTTVFQLAGWDNSAEFSAWQQLRKNDSRHWLNVRMGVNDWMSPANPSDVNNKKMNGNYSFSLGYGYMLTDKLMPYLTVRKDLNRADNIGFVTGVDISTKTRLCYTVGFTSTYDVTQDWNRSNAWVDVYYKIGNNGWKIGVETAVTVTGEVGFLWMINKSINWSRK